MLIALRGLRGTGKTTVARCTTSHRAATNLRVDAIKQAMRDVGVSADGIGAACYAVATYITW